MFGPHGLLAELENEEINKKSEDDDQTKDRQGATQSQSVAQNTAKRSRTVFRSDEKPILECDNSGPVHKNKKIKSCALETINAQVGQSQDNFVPLNSISSEQAAFSIPKIIEKIFSFLSPGDLLQFRRVSRDWRKYATNETLLKWKGIAIKLGKMSVCKYLKCTTITGYNKFKEPVQELTNLLDGTDSLIFPCSQFEIMLSNWENEGKEIETFLTNHGYRIKKLTLDLYYRGKCNSVSSDGEFKPCSHQDKWLLHILAKLVHQTPNLVDIQIKFNIRGPNRKTCKSLAKNLKIIGVDIGIDAAPRNFLLKLQSFTISWYIPKSTFDFICGIAPNLTVFNCGHIEYYLEPINRLYLCKSLKYSPEVYDFGDNELNIIHRIANTEGKLDLNLLRIDTRWTDDEYQPDWPEAVDIINKLVEKSCHSLKTLELTPVGFLPGLHFPKMPNVHTIYFHALDPDDQGQGDDDDNVNQDPHFLPHGVCLSDTFPNLINLRIGLDLDDDESSVTEYPCTEDDFFLISSEKQIVESVREIKVKWNPVISVQQYRRWFPNARIITEF